MQCVILAAGSGSRLSSLSNSKPLLPVLGVPIIERNIRTMLEAGIRDFIVVTGSQSDAVTNFLDELAARLSVNIHSVYNPDWSSSENGRSILVAEPFVAGHFILAMADHLTEAPLLKRLLENTDTDAVLSLAVDQQLGNPTVDLDDVTRVQFKDDRLQKIGKGLEKYQGWDTGFFYCHKPADFFQALRQCNDSGKSTLSEAVQLLANQQQVRTVDVSGCYWNDVDSPRQLQLIEQWLLDRMRGKERDGPISRHLNRPLSIRVSKILARWPITPNQISIGSFLMSLVAAVLIAQGATPLLILGGLLAQLASVIDGCDGEIARLKYQGSEYGGWLDAVLDRYGDAALLLALTWVLAQQHAGDWVWLLGIAAIVGSFMVSYTADKYDQWVQQQGIALRLGRDLRILLIALAAITGWIAPVLLLIAVLMNGEAIRRVWMLRPRRSTPAKGEAAYAADNLELRGS